MDPTREDYIGLRVARYRDLAGLTQQELADRVGISRSHVTNIEGGRRAVTTRRLLNALAEALGLTVADLIAVPTYTRTAPERELLATVPDLRAALDGAADLAPVPFDQLLADLDAAAGARMSCDYPTMARLLAPVVGRTHALAQKVQTDIAESLFARACVTASLAIRPLGYVDLATRFAERAQRAALVGEDVAARAAADFAIAQTSLAAGGLRGLRTRSLAIAERAADHAQDYGDDDDVRTWYGMLHLQAALAAASLGDDDNAMAHVDEAADVATARDADVSSADRWRMDFTSANVGVWRVAVALEGSDPGSARELTRRVDYRALRTVQRRAHLFIHTGRAHYANDDHDAATRAFLTADGMAPAEVRGRSSVREIIGQMVRDARRRAGSEALRDLAARVGANPFED